MADTDQITSGNALRLGTIYQALCLFLVEGLAMLGGRAENMRVEIHTPESATEPRFWVEHQPVLAMALRSGSIEIGLHRSKMRRFTYSPGRNAANLPPFGKVVQNRWLTRYDNRHFGRCTKGSCG